MADWVDGYVETTLYGPGELDRLFNEYEAGRISRSYMLGLFGMSEEVFDGTVRRRKSVQRDESEGARPPGGQRDGVRTESSG
jgi:hypothetical protein